jgi:hypothetical protein
MELLDIGRSRRLLAWLEALDELHAEAHRGVDPTSTAGPSSIAVLHALEDRAHQAFTEYREYVLQRSL